jgi:hypothetical protein
MEAQGVKRGIQTSAFIGKSHDIFFFSVLCRDAAGDLPRHASMAWRGKMFMWRFSIMVAGRAIRELIADVRKVF